MNENLPSSLTFTLNRQPVFYIRQNEVLSPSIQISPTADKEFCVPLYAGFEFDDASILELQAQGVDKLAESLQSYLDSLPDRDYMGKVKAALRDEIFNCRDFAKQLRSPTAKSNLCDSCNDWPRGGCSPTCNAYQKSTNGDSTDYSYHGKSPSMQFSGRRDEHQ
ncbi:hypothetical protein MIB43_017135 [Providencia rettgeri]|uniref:hypothetical protein n=1 Tax=Providencia rettgeri TaxID=587 RepID=UPI001F0337E1|nr:hypothetical protein [Providencia rettgeri]MCG9951637.1 hypothetical protein [Providencia rettgeri]